MNSWYSVWPSLNTKFECFKSVYVDFSNKFYLIENYENVNQFLKQQSETLLQVI